MMILNNIKDFISKTDLKTFYYYIIGYGATCVVLCFLMIIYYYRSVNELKKNIKHINAYREDILEVLTDFEKIKQQQTIVEEILAKDPSFKIAGELKTILEKLGLTDKEHGKGEIAVIDLEDNYRKNELSAKFENMSMQDLTRLLEELEKNPRIATERLEITKKQKTIDASLTISTLLPKTENTATQGT